MALARATCEKDAGTSQPSADEARPNKSATLEASRFEGVGRAPEFDGDSAPSTSAQTTPITPITTVSTAASVSLSFSLSLNDVIASA